MKSPVYFCIVISVFLFCEIFYCRGSPLQYVEFFSDISCTNSTGRILRDTTYIRIQNDTNGWDSDSWSLQIDGMWGITSIPDSKPYLYPEVIYGRDSCFRPMFKPSQLYMVERFGPPSETAPEIYFYREKSLLGQGTICSTDSLGLYPAPFELKSFVFTGDHKWSVYSGYDKTGEFICLEPSSDVRNDGYGMTYNYSTNILAASIHYGCERVQINGASRTNSFVFIIFVFSVSIQSLLTKLI